MCVCACVHPTALMCVEGRKQPQVSAFDIHLFETVSLCCSLLCVPGSLTHELWSGFPFCLPPHCRSTRLQMWASISNRAGPGNVKSGPCILPTGPPHQPKKELWWLSKIIILKPKRSLAWDCHLILYWANAKTDVEKHSSFQIFKMSRLLMFKKIKSLVGLGWKTEEALVSCFHWCKYPSCMLMLLCSFHLDDTGRLWVKVSLLLLGCGFWNTQT